MEFCWIIGGAAEWVRVCGVSRPLVKGVPQSSVAYAVNGIVPAYRHRKKTSRGVNFLSAGRNVMDKHAMHSDAI